MGLMIHSLCELPINVERGYYVYLLDYGWKEPISDAMYLNFERMADMASKHNAVILRGIVGAHFADEVLSWHQINGQDAESLLPAILITTKHPNDFREHSWNHDELKDQLLIIPLRDICKSPDEVIPLIDHIFQDIKEKGKLSGFKIAKKIRAGQGRAIVDSLILKPNFVGLGIDLNKIFDFFHGHKKT